VVVVDDEPTLLACIATILEEESYDVFAADSALQALQYLRAYGADLILSDVKMPRNDGLTLVRWLNADPDLMRIPVILFTSVPDEGPARKLGIFDYIHKPVGREELLRRVFAGICYAVGITPLVDRT
jgi:CheY-like chemotaxis protein